MRIKHLIILSLFILNTTLIYSQKSVNERELLPFIELIVSQTEIQEILLVKSVDKIESIYIQANSKKYEFKKEISDTTSYPQYFIWNSERIFFNDIEKWILLTKIRIGKKKARIELSTCSNTKEHTQNFIGKIRFEKVNNDWKIYRIEVDKTNKTCNLYEQQRHANNVHKQ